MTHHPTTRVARLRRFAIALLAASTVAVGSLALPASASALPMSCAQAFEIARSYFSLAHVFEAYGHYDTAKFWRQQGLDLVDENCPE